MSQPQSQLPTTVGALQSIDEQLQGTIQSHPQHPAINSLMHSARESDLKSLP